MYEYEQIAVGVADIKSTANDWARGGWRLAHVVPLPVGFAEAYFVLVFEREVPAHSNAVALRAA